jgi:NADP-dependent 3-hydroxy acid dehydrogenase YdfG
MTSITVKKKQSIVITGANKGIGFECVTQFCEDYADNLIIAISRSIDNLTQLDYLNLQVIKCDVSQFQELKSALENIVNNYQISALINCAGTSYNGDFCEINNAKIQQIIDVNIMGLTNTVELVLPHMRTQKLGTIINISSLSDRYPRPNNAVYGASKAYVKSLSDSLRVSEAQYNIRVCNISPAIIDTPLLAKVGKNLNEIIAVSNFVNIIKFIYQQPHSICIRDIVVAPTSYKD